MELSEQSSEEKSIDWDALHAGYVAGNDARAAELFEHITKSFLPRILKNIDLGLKEDEVQELVARLNHKLHAGGKLRQYQGPETFLGWLRILAANERNDYFRKIYRGANVLSVSKDAVEVEDLKVDHHQVAPSNRKDPVEAAQMTDIMRILTRCLDTLAKDDREMVERRLLKEEEYEEIAVAMGLKVHSAHLNFFRARRRLAECMAKSGAGVQKSKKPVKDSDGKDVSP